MSQSGTGRRRRSGCGAKTPGSFSQAPRAAAKLFHSSRDKGNNGRGPRRMEGVISGMRSVRDE